MCKECSRRGQPMRPTPRASRGSGPEIRASAAPAERHHRVSPRRHPATKGRGWSQSRDKNPTRAGIRGRTRTRSVEYAHDCKIQSRQRPTDDDDAFIETYASADDRAQIRSRGWFVQASTRRLARPNPRISAGFRGNGQFMIGVGRRRTGNRKFGVGPSRQ